MAVAEAQALAIPAVVCDYGAMRERVVDNKTGYVCKNTEDFNLKAIKLLNDDKIWMRMHRNLLTNDNHLRWSEIAKKMDENNKLKILNILGGTKQGGAEKFFERLSFALEKEEKYQFTIDY